MFLYAFHDGFSELEARWKLAGGASHRISPKPISPGRGCANPAGAAGPASLRDARGFGQISGGLRHRLISGLPLGVLVQLSPGTLGQPVGIFRLRYPDLQVSAKRCPAHSFSTNVNFNKGSVF